MNDAEINAAKEHFGKILKEQLKRVEDMKASSGWMDYSKLDKLVIGVVGGDGIGPFICKHAEKVLKELLKDEIASGKVEVRTIDGLTIENRAKQLKAIPDEVLAELKKCHVILKGPTTTPMKGVGWAIIESANVAISCVLYLFAKVRPVRMPEQGIDWIFFRENTEGGYILGSKGVDVNDDIAIDFTVATTQGCERIIRLAFDHARKTASTA